MKKLLYLNIEYNFNKIFMLLALFTLSFGYAQNLLTNGDFESGPPGKTAPGWTGNALNVVEENNNKYSSADVAIAGDAWNVNLSYPLSIPNIDKVYKLTFKAWSDTNRPILAGIGLFEGDFKNVNQTVNLTTTSNTYVLILKSNFGSPNSRVFFDMGHAIGFVGIDDVVLELMATCTNGVQDGDETQIDCGGTSCPPCSVPVTGPTIAAPTPPTRSAADVVSIYSDAYTTAMTFDSFDAGWCEGTASTEVEIAGNKTLRKNTGKNCHGIDFKSDRKDLTSFTHIHFDFYIADTNLTGDVFNVKLVDFAGGNVEASSLQVNINGGTTPALVTNQWVQVDVPITALGGVVAGNLTRSDAAQFVISNPNVDNVWYDNIYFYKDSTLSNNEFENAKFSLYPNPAKEVLTISAKGIVEKVQIYNYLGQEVLSKNINKEKTSVNVSELSRGMYIVKSTINGIESSNKFMKQ